LLVVDHESRLVGQCLFRFLASAQHDEIRDADALALSRNLDQGFFRCGGTKLKRRSRG
jgi:hypothetical protein